jgi:hypothetical protein
MTPPTGEAPKQLGERTDSSIKRLPNGNGWRAAHPGEQTPFAPTVSRWRTRAGRSAQIGHGPRAQMRWLTYDPSTELESREQKAVTAAAADDIWTPGPD